MKSLATATTHLVGPAIFMDGKLVQRCMICGERIGLRDGVEAWRVGTWLRVKPGYYGDPPQHVIMGTADPEKDQDLQEVPAGCCIDLVEN